jgi:hypothetical protein
MINDVLSWIKIWQVPATWYSCEKPKH